jgi:hypothetical protein
MDFARLVRPTGDSVCPNSLSGAMAKGAAEGESHEHRSFKKSKSHLDIEFIASKEFDGPKKDRSCTDIFFLLLILCGWISMTCETLGSNL